MKVIIPLAGFGTRLRPHTYTKPKPLMHVAGKPFLAHLLDKLATLDVEEYIFIVGYLGDQIEDYVRKHYHFKAHFVEQKEMLGQAHAIWLAKEHLDENPTFILFADTLFETDIEAVNRVKDDALIFVKEVEDPRSFGVVTLDKAGYITKFVEKPSTKENRLAVIGLYYFSSGQALIKAIETLMTRKIMTKGEFFLADAMQIMVEEGKRFRVEPVSVWLDCGRPETLLETNRYLLDHAHDNSKEFEAFDGVVIIPPVHIHPTAKLENSIIGPHVTIAANCHIERSIISDSVIDEGAACKNSVLAQSLVGRYAHVEDHARSVNVGDSSAVSFAE